MTTTTARTSMGQLQAQYVRDCTTAEIKHRLVASMIERAVGDAVLSDESRMRLDAELWRWFRGGRDATEIKNLAVAHGLAPSWDEWLRDHSGDTEAA